MVLSPGDRVVITKDAIGWKTARETGVLIDRRTRPKGMLWVKFDNLIPILGYQTDEADALWIPEELIEPFEGAF